MLDLNGSASHKFGNAKKNKVKDNNYWKQYPVEVNADEIEKCISKEIFFSEDRKYELLSIKHPDNRPCLLISMGSGGHAYVFVELAYLIYKKGVNVFIMPKHGGFTVTELVKRHVDALNHLRASYENVHIYSEGLGGLVVFYLALNDAKITSLIFENSPAILTEDAFHDAMKKDGKAGRRRAFLLHFFKQIVKVFPKFPVPIRAYLAWHEVIDSNSKNHDIENKLVSAYDHDPDFDKSYSLEAVMSLVNTPPPASIDKLNIPTLFIWAKRGLIPAYFKNVFSRLMVKQKHLEEVDGGVFWMLSNPEKASELIANWIKNVN